MLGGPDGGTEEVKMGLISDERRAELTALMLAGPSKDPDARFQSISEAWLKKPKNSSDILKEPATPAVLVVLSLTGMGSPPSYSGWPRQVLN